LGLKDLRKIAVENLRFLLPEIKVEEQMDATGFRLRRLRFQPLVDGFDLTNGEISVDGECVVAIPSRDVL